jgi:hypothetical protein
LYFQELADDVSDVVRTICAYGICRIVATYWEILPAERIKELIEVVVQKHACDSSSSNVRIAVIKVRVTFPVKVGVKVSLRKQLFVVYLR